MKASLKRRLKTWNIGGEYIRDIYLGIICPADKLMCNVLIAKLSQTYNSGQDSYGQRQSLSKLNTLVLSLVMSFNYLHYLVTPGNVRNL